MCNTKNNIESIAAHRGIYRVWLLTHEQRYATTGLRLDRSRRCGFSSRSWWSKSQHSPGVSILRTMTNLPAERC